MKSSYFLSIAFVLFTIPAMAQQDTITDLSLFSKDAALYKAPNGKIYHVSFKEDDESEVGHERSITPGVASANSTTSSSNVACDHDNVFDGSYRKKAKTSIAVNIASSTNLAKLISRLKDINKNTIIVSSSSSRISIEDSVVTLISVFLYAIARESDEDYHIIIGTSNNPSTSQFFNIECSGLPATSSSAFNKLKAVRQKVTTLLGGSERCQGGYIFFTDHPKVKIIGSLFYDKEHENQLPGPSGNKPLTAWELHPITEFKVL